MVEKVPPKRKVSVTERIGYGIVAVMSLFVMIGLIKTKVPFGFAYVVAAMGTIMGMAGAVRETKT